MIWREGGQVWVMDLHSTNGTRVDGARIATRIALRKDACIQIGDTAIQLRVTSPRGAGTGQENRVTQHDQPGNPYNATVWYGHDVPDQATFTAVDGSARTTLTAERRVALVYVLASKLRADRLAGRPQEEQGWCTDDDVGIGVWGRQWWNQRPGRLNVLVHRVRRVLESHQINPDCLQKTGGRLRLWIQRVDLAEPTISHPSLDESLVNGTAGASNGVPVI